MATLSTDPPSDSSTLSEVERIRALVMNVHGVLRRTEAARLVESSIEAIHRSLDRLEESAQRRNAADHPIEMSIVADRTVVPPLIGQ